METSLQYGSRAQRPEVVQGLSSEAPFEWLRLGWQDFGRSAGASVAYGAMVVVFGYILFGLTAGRPYLFLGAVSGFFLVAPLLAAGLYEISRRHGDGAAKVTFGESLSCWRRNGQSIADFGLVLVIAMLCWQMLSALWFAFYFRGDLTDVTAFANSLFFEADSLGFLIGYIALGAVIAAFVFAIAAVAVPMLVDREVDVVTAMMTSFRVVRGNLRPMLIWAGLIVALTLFGFATLMFGLAVIIPWLGHASWHAYKSSVR